ncbi:uncharacterized protein E0L32_002952 [Thyridium curvatum]|uniref:Uncharacterized protein n=1 Tax=Thyridium curvatum TaxID=1093900 RepID=A0A507BL23_9PEZI|nr:uncharacterized protein E0L32_002952 [Thyridium curvatum]TPX17851.1 hypothetical protein E0L32_002952 [Thyridium curvatum]
MRLLNVHTFQLVEFLGKKPEYAILSHTWEKREILFEHMTQPTKSLKKRDGWDKVSNCCKQARTDGLGYVWIDTCCIDKSSSAELSEAINSMFAWYASAEICYTYLSDLELPEDRSNYDLEASLRTCRWFTRGFTLQELIAPCQVWFFDKNWNYVGKRDDADENDWQWSIKSQPVHEMISAITHIPVPVLGRGSKREQPMERLEVLMRGFSISQRMNWAAGRSTTRVEDEAYCLLGLFSIHMPLLYGEGKKAFRRLQDEIMRGSNDQSIFATNEHTLLASSPDGFIDSRTGKSSPVDLISLQRTCLSSGNVDDSFVDAGPSVISMTLFICPLKNCSTRSIYLGYHASTAVYLGILNCAFQNDIYRRPVIILEKLNGQRTFFRKTNGYLTGMPSISCVEMEGTQQIYDNECRADARLERVSIIHSYEASILEYTSVDQCPILSIKIHLADKYKLLSYSPPQTRLHRTNGLVVIQLPGSGIPQIENNGRLRGIAVVETPHGSNLLVGWGGVGAAMSDGESQQQGFMGCQAVKMAQGPLNLEEDSFLSSYLTMMSENHDSDLQLTRGQEIGDSVRSGVWIEEKEILGHRDCDLYIGYELTSDQISRLFSSIQ